MRFESWRYKPMFASFKEARLNLKKEEVAYDLRSH